MLQIECDFISDTRPHMNSLLDEIESLEAILMDDVKIFKNADT